MTNLSTKSSEALCNLVVVSKDSCAEIIAEAGIAFYLPDSAPASIVLSRIHKLKEHYSKLHRAMIRLDDVIDELNGRKPPARHDEQVAA